MIVTCPACSSRYKLDESKVTGRGAKITCPKCKHVFVVYPGGTTGPLPEAAPKVESSTPNLAANAMPQTVPPSDEWDDEPTRIGMQKPPAPEPRRPANPTIAVPMDDPPFQISPEEAAARSPTLDFKKVGVSTWKVKIKIGLIYDFSDIKTLRKYIQDGRVTQQDVISYDGKLWRALGDIPDLDVYFVQTWEELNRTRPVDIPKPPPPPKKEETPKPSAPTTAPFRDPFAQKTGPIKKPAAPPPAPAKNSNRTALYGIAGLLVFVAVGAGWYFGIGPGAGATPALNTRPPATTTIKPKDEQEKIRRELEEKLRPVEPVDAGEQVPFDPNDDADGDGRADGLTPINRPGVPVGATPVQPRQPQTMPGVQPQVPPTNVVREATGADAADAGDSSIRNGDYAGAVRAYQQAVALEPNNGGYLRKLGEAQYKAGDADNARLSLQKAAQTGQASAYKMLGEIARAQGDTSGASQYYQQYLASNPKDAADIQAILTSLQGG